MTFQKLILALAGLLSFHLTAQLPRSFGQIDPEDTRISTRLNLEDAPAVVLYETGNHYYKEDEGSIYLFKTYFKRMKILSRSGLDETDVKISLYRSGNTSEIVQKLEAITHRDGRATYLAEKDIYETVVNENWTEIRFTFADVQVGDIVEYQYTLRSPFIGHLDGWKFQSHLPKLYSEFRADIPGNFIFNRAVRGLRKLDINESVLKKSCFVVTGYYPADCESIHYAMIDVPGFKEEEHMLSVSNYVSSLDFQLEQYIRFDGIKRNYARSWEDVDEEFRSNPDVGKQARKSNFFSRYLPEHIMLIENPLERAQAIFRHVKLHFSWNGKYGYYKDNDVKEAFRTQGGNAAEINLSLINLLRAADLNAEILLLATRDKGLPKKIHPDLNDFNYIAVYLSLEGKTYFLDASEDLIPFGTLPYRCLNGYGRVLDFKKGSYWIDLPPDNENRILNRVRIAFDSKEERLKGSLQIDRNGYPAMHRIRYSQNATEDEILNDMNLSPDIHLLNFENQSGSLGKADHSERVEFEIMQDLEASRIAFPSVLVPLFNQNPFLTDTRTYPIDFGYPRQFMYFMELEVPDGFRVAEHPDNGAWSLPNKAGSMQLSSSVNGDTFQLILRLILLETSYEPGDYPTLKAFFRQALQLQKKKILLERVSG